MTTPTNKPRSVRRWLDRLVRLWQLHLFFVVESRAYIGRYTWRDRLQWPLAWWYFMRASVRDMRSPNSELNDSKSQYPVANTPPKAEESQ